MSESDSFISEVTEEVRRDRLFGYLRRYGWIGVVLVILIVGGASFFEYRRAVERTEAETLGDALLDALENPDEAVRVLALANSPATGPEAAIPALLTATEQQRAGDTAAARATLEALAVNGDVDPLYRDLAQIKALMLGPDDSDPAARAAALDALSIPGAPYRLLALEQRALDQLAASDTDAALTTLRAIAEDAAVSNGQRQRVDALIVAVGGELAVDQGAPPAQD